MTIAYWIVAGLAALAFLAAGLMKLTRPKEALAASGLAWTEDFSQPNVRLIGTAEVLGALGLILPGLVIAPVLGPIAALALTALMIGAISVHLRRKETFIPALVLAVITAIAAVLGFVSLG